MYLYVAGSLSDMPAQLIGAHMPTGEGLDDAIRRAKEIGCTALQVFTSSPRQWYSKPIDPATPPKLARAFAETGLDPRAIVSHDTYLINLSAPTPEIAEKSKKALARELQRCGELGIPYVVSHMGASKGQDEIEALRIVAEATIDILKESPPEVTLLMETTAGQGSSLNCKFEHLAALLEVTGAPNNLGVCLDTCHIFAAGYDIRTPEGYTETFERFDQLIGADRIKVIHANDSKKPFASRLDRHAHIGEGEIGEIAFRCLVHDPRFERVPIIIETPDAEEMHAVNVKRLFDYARDSSPL